MSRPEPPSLGTISAAPWDQRRHAMVESQIRARGISDAGVLAAMSAVPRHEFVPPQVRSRAYEDCALAIGEGQTISQPYMVAFIAASLRLTGVERMLEIGLGSGYQAAVLSPLAREVFAVEIHPSLAASARDLLARLGCANVHVRVGDGSQGWPEEAPFDAIIVSAAAPFVPSPLLEQLAEGGRLVMPVGPAQKQGLQLVLKRSGRLSTNTLLACAFVPLVGSHGVPPIADR
jgi:protein-L-isoaspartate(D-aspartate) O-methyltransferase